MTKRREWAAAFLFLLPNFLGFLVLTAIPVIASFVLSLFNWKLLDKPSYAGFSNFAELFSDSLFWKSTLNTAVFVLAKVPITIGLALLIAIILNRKLVGRNLFRTIVFLPVICSSVSVALIWQPLFDQSSGFLNMIVGFFGGKPIPWLSSTKWAMTSVVGVAIWKEIGYAMVIFLAGLQSIPRTYYEAAEVDGASGMQVFFHITVPLISPTTFFVLVTSVIGSFQVFDLTTVLTQGGPGNSTNTLVMYIYQSAFKNFRMGYASALALMLFLIVLVLTLTQNRSSGKWVQE
jgi:multiple sugar transport system permease protein